MAVEIATGLQVDTTKPVRLLVPTGIGPLVLPIQALPTPTPATVEDVLEPLRLILSMLVAPTIIPEALETTTRLIADGLATTLTTLPALPIAVTLAPKSHVVMVGLTPTPSPSMSKRPLEVASTGLVIAPSTLASTSRPPLTPGVEVKLPTGTTAKPKIVQAKVGACEPIARLRAGLTRAWTGARTWPWPGTRLRLRQGLVTRDAKGLAVLVTKPTLARTPTLQAPETVVPPTPLHAPRLPGVGHASVQLPEAVIPLAVTTKLGLQIPLLPAPKDAPTPTSGPLQVGEPTLVASVALAAATGPQVLAIILARLVPKPIHQAGRILATIAPPIEAGGATAEPPLATPLRGRKRIFVADFPFCDCQVQTVGLIHCF